MKYIAGIVCKEGPHRIYMCPINQLTPLAERLTQDADNPNSPVSMILAMQIIADAVVVQASYLRTLEEKK